MKIFQTSYHDKPIVREIEEMIGKPFSFLQILKMKGIGSRRLEVIEASPEFGVARNATHYQTLVNIEIRPKGLAIYFRHKLDNYTAVVPYDGLSLELKRDAVLYQGASFIRLKDAYKKDTSFFNKMIELGKLQQVQ